MPRERLFNEAEYIANDQRLSFYPENVSVLSCLRGWIKKLTTCISRAFVDRRTETATSEISRSLSQSSCSNTLSHFVVHNNIFTSDILRFLATRLVKVVCIL